LISGISVKKVKYTVLYAAAFFLAAAGILFITDTTIDANVSPATPSTYSVSEDEMKVQPSLSLKSDSIGIEAKCNVIIN
jgi:hypothetical protein